MIRDMPPFRSQGSAFFELTHGPAARREPPDFSDGSFLPSPLADGQGRAPPPSSQERESAKSGQHHGPGGRFRDGDDRPEEPVLLAVDAIGEEEGVRVSIIPTAAESQGPQTARRVAGAG